ncbi:sigma-54 dependent transcriptional regulator [Sinanaerobacter sp. ZZT-01]|uniref:sigma-54-dependent transcriptional regulator n=1 Tax=Sinanaerobacter sp. ZZT-01 TaxID=3111540 RepID=UPI002D77AAAF|nr:sigma-54 dependent transcriptional regulator [Sinanaerobacter sp. ZZT-01]WRR94738.1 sigma-54 dependent transcriptional regulator [Sinanaerobacter sp. ZZT-01]
MNYNTQILLVDDDIGLLKVYEKIFTLKNFNVITASNSLKALDIIKRQQIAVVISDIIMPKMDGMALLKEIKECSPITEVIMLTAEGSVSGAVEAVHKGAFTYLLKPADIEELLFNVKRAYEVYSIKEENYVLRQQISDITKEEPLIGNSLCIKKIKEKVETIAPMDSTVLIMGESGTGKEILANMIYNKSKRKDRTFVRVNCAALTQNLLESELFGHEKGAFTGADRMRKGRFEMAQEGTILLDEIGELPLGTQAKLLRVLQEKEFERVGGSSTIKTDFRLIAATNKDLRQEVENHRFREDLFYRINVLPLTIPPLRERREDIPILTDYFLKQIAKEVKKPVMLFEKEALQQLLEYEWPGNVRELKNVIERLVVLSKHEKIDLEDIPEEIRNKNMKEDILQLGETIKIKTLSEARKEFEKIFILKALDRNEWSITKTAEELQLARKNLYKKLHEYKIKFS